MRIGVFDSGIGGLTVLKELIATNPNHHYIYFGDTLNMPYGDKSKEELHVLVNNIIEFLIKKRVDKIVIACGTVSSNIDDNFKKQYNIPIIDIISPTIKYINQKKYDKLGLIATSMTVKSKVFSNKIKVINEQACPLFVPIIENNEIDTELCQKVLEEYLLPLKQDNVKTLILGCTHYPLLESKIKEYFNHEITTINMGTVLANNLDMGLESMPKIDLYFSDITDNLTDNVYNIIGIKKLYLEIVGDKDA